MRKQIANRLGAAHIRDTVQQFVAGEIDRQVWQDRLPAYAASEGFTGETPLEDVNDHLGCLIDYRNGFEKHRDLGDTYGHGEAIVAREVDQGRSAKPIGAGSPSKASASVDFGLRKPLLQMPERKGHAPKPAENGPLPFRFCFLQIFRFCFLHDNCKFNICRI